jgi:hypothetical protein
MKQKLINSKDFLKNGKEGKTIGEKLTDKRGKTELLTPQQAPGLNLNPI